MINEIKKLLGESADVKVKMANDAGILEKIGRVVEEIVRAYTGGNKVILFGNGGSAGDAQHIAGELVGRFYKERKALPALALNSNSSVVTALGNDYGYESVFRRQVEAHARPGDVVVGISTSGNSPNVVKALELAKERGAFTVGLTGLNESKTSEVADLCIRVPSSDTPRIQEGHITLGHIICYLVERALFPTEG
ncbi:MAG: D-sedoheptulose-7-phosphate isomerase [Promethearchaeota archaeon]